MGGTDLLKAFLSMSLGSVPTVLACLVAIIVVLSQGQRIPGAVPWALLGFGLALVMSVVGPFSGFLLQRYFVSHALSYEHNAWMFGVVSLINSTLHGVALIFLLVAVLAGRTSRLVPSPLVPPPLPPV